MRRLFLSLMLMTLPALAQTPLIEGNASSPVRVIIYEDLQCPDCAEFRRMMDEKLLPKYHTKVAFEHRDFPLAKHAWARRAAVAARYFQTVNAGVATAYRQHVMQNIEKISPEQFEADLRAFAKQHQQDPDKVAAGLQDQRLADLVEKDFREGVARGVSKTPTVFVDGEPFIETFTLEQISKAIETALASAAK